MPPSSPPDDADDAATSGPRRRGRGGPGGLLRGPLRLLVPVAVLTVLVVVAGVLLLLPGGPPPEPDGEAAVPVSTSMLLGPEQLAPLGAARTWEVAGTGDNTEGDGINTVCQAARFADPDGEGTLVRRLRPAGTADDAPVDAPVDAPSLLETVEVSRTTQSASDAFATTLGWFAGCREAQVRLVDAWRVQGLGSRSAVVRLRAPASGGGTRDLLVGVVRSDRVTVSLVADQPSARATDVEAFAEVVRAAVTGLCRADAAGFCPTRSRVVRVEAPPSGEARGTLAVTDLPALPRVDQPWVGTSPEPARPNGAATSCDGTEFVRAGAPRAVSRTYLVPQSDLPDRFGLTQTIGTFPGGPRAQRLVDDVQAAMAGCEDDDLSVTVAVARVGQVRAGTVTSYWRLEQEVSDDRTVASWMGVARVGRHATQVLFTPGGGADLDEQAFAAVLDRARDRLRELEGRR